jgi:hypothetical protein
MLVLFSDNSILKHFKMICYVYKYFVAGFDVVSGRYIFFFYQHLLLDHILCWTVGTFYLWYRNHNNEYLTPDTGLSALGFLGLLLDLSGGLF